MFDMPFGVDMPLKKLCDVELNFQNWFKIQTAAQHEYMFEFYIDSIPVHGALGTKSTDTSPPKIFNKFEFEISFNHNQIIAAKVIQSVADAIDLLEFNPDDIQTLPIFTSVRWVPTNVSFSDRMKQYIHERRASVFVEIHWLSIINAFVLVLLLTGFLTLILLRSVKNDITSLSNRRGDLEGSGKGVGSEDDEAGWKLLQHDVFRAPTHLNLFSAIIGTGAQLILICASVLVLCLLGTFQPHNRGALYTAFIALYSLTAVIAGYVSVRTFIRLGGKAWVRNIITTTVLYAGPCLVVSAFLNTIALVYGTSRALPATTIVLLALVWVLVTFPLTVIGGIAGKNAAQKQPYLPPVTPHVRPRQLPSSLPWFASPWFQLAFAGFLPFSAIYMELFSIFASVWSQKMYTLYGVLTIAIILLLAVSSMVTIALVYFQLTAQDWQWWWRSVLCGGAMGGFVCLYSVYYFFVRSDMFGFHQTSFFFGYSFLLSYAVFLALGSAGYLATNSFVHYIFTRSKLA
eukprot:c16404_g1_i2.p1 GENE.c16404_g1_i2~~c16404_g1_i2.p1  ORF type:complete len:599 (-),score=128.02 c16404_g1_i2:104-1648(-)